MSKKFFVSLESEVEVVNDSPEALVQSELDTERVHNDSEDQISDIAEVSDTVSEGIDSVDTLTDIGSNLKDKIDDKEGLSEDAAKITEVAIESIRMRLGMPKSMIRIPSMENFKAPHSRVESTRITLENIKEGAIEVWNRILEFIKSIISKIKIFFAGLMKNYDTLKTHLEAIKKKAESLTGEPESDKLDKPHLAKFFTGKDGKANLESAQESIKTINGFTDVATKVLTYVGTQSDILERTSKETTYEGGEAIYTKVFNEVSRLLSDAGYFPSKKKDKEEARVGPIPGNQYIVINPAGFFKNIGFEFVDSDTNADTIVSLKKQEIIDLLTAAIESSKKKVNIEEIEKLSDKALKDINDNIEKIKKSPMYSSANFENKVMFKQASIGTKALLSIVTKISSKLPSIHFSTLKHVGEYAIASIGQFKKTTAPAASTTPPAAA